MSETENEADEEFCEQICEEEREKRVHPPPPPKKKEREKKENLKKCVGIGKVKEALGG